MIRDLTRDDLPTLMQLAEVMHAESVYAEYPLNTDRTEYVLATLLDADTVFCKGAEVDGNLVGVFFGEINIDIWADVSVAKDIVFYVLPEHRAGGQGVRLIKSFYQWTSGRCDEVVLSVYAGVTNAATGDILARMGYADAGTIHKKRAA